MLIEKVQEEESPSRRRRNAMSIKVLIIGERNI